MSDKFRDPRLLTTEDRAQLDEIRKKAAELEALYDKVLPRGRYVSLAITSLEESVLWVTKEITT